VYSGEPSGEKDFESKTRDRSLSNTPNWSEKNYYWNRGRAEARDWLVCSTENSSQRMPQNGRCYEPDGHHRSMREEQERKLEESSPELEVKHCVVLCGVVVIVFIT